MLSGSFHLQPVDALTRDVSTMPVAEPVPEHVMNRQRPDFGDGRGVAMTPELAQLRILAGRLCLSGLPAATMFP
jgi:hypothetical protein